MKQINRKLAFRSESIRRLNSTQLVQAAGGKKKPSQEKNCTSDSDGDGKGGDGDSWSNTGGSGSLNPITTLVRHID